MSLHKEIHLEEEICEHLAAHDWHYAEGDAAHYDRALALYPPDVLAWAQETQPKAWEALSRSHGDQAGKVLLERLRNRIDAQGTLHVLRHGIDMLGLKGKLELVQFKPALAMNPELMAKYKANRLRVVRQVHYSQHNENSIDLVLFLNGLPVATVELKSDFTQSVEDAVDQLRTLAAALAADRRYHADIALKAEDGILQLLVDHVAVRDHHHRVEDLLLFRVVQIGKEVRRPRNRVCLA